MEIKEKIIEKHKDDKEHLEFIFSEEKQIVVTAPAGCGKTTAMISKLAWELTKNLKPDHKKILAMSFSINAATKIKDSLNEMLPELVNNSKYYIEKVDVSNYHNFAMRLLYKYGFALSNELINIQEFRIVDDFNHILNEYLTSSQIDIIHTLNDKINNINLDNINKYIDEYYKLFDEILFKNHVITYNAIILCGIKLLSLEGIGKFFRKYYKTIIIDEFQDTNYLSYMLISKLISKENSLIIMGDDVQKIYGFLGALPNLLTILEKKQHMKKIEFKTNYRFKDNQDMKNLDKLLREYNINYSNNGLNANLKVKSLKNEQEENEFIANGIEYIANNLGEKVAVLFKANYMAKSLLDVLNNQNITYFNALFKDTDVEYVKYHQFVLEIFYKYTDDKEFINKSIADKCLLEIEKRKKECCINEDNTYIIDSLFELTKIMFNRLNQFGNNAKERFERINFLLSSNGLKRMIEFVDKNIIITTVHSAKGLEWDYVIIPRMMAYSFPSSNALCKQCKSLKNAIEGYDYCKFGFSDSLSKSFSDEMSVFYVAITRAKKDVFITLNKGNNQWGYPQKTSCFLGLDGLNKIDYDWSKV